MTSNVIPMFTFDGQQVRCTLIDGEPWFAAPDASRILGISDSNVALRPLDEDEKAVIGKPNTLSARYTDKRFERAAEAGELSVFFTDPRASRIRIISRPGLFALIARSNKPNAKRFDRWVRHEVLPPSSIRYLERGAGDVPAYPSNG